MPACPGDDRQQKEADDEGGSPESLMTQFELLKLVVLPQQLDLLLLLTGFEDRLKVCEITPNLGGLKLALELTRTLLGLEGLLGVSTRNLGLDQGVQGNDLTSSHPHGPGELEAFGRGGNRLGAAPEARQRLGLDGEAGDEFGLKIEPPLDLHGDGDPVERLVVAAGGLQGGGETAIGLRESPFVTLGLTQRQGFEVDLDGLFMIVLKMLDVTDVGENVGNAVGLSELGLDHPRALKELQRLVVVAQVHVRDADVVEQDGFSVPVTGALPHLESARAGFDGIAVVALLKLGGGDDVEQSPRSIGLVPDSGLFERLAAHRHTPIEVAEVKARTRLIGETSSLEIDQAGPFRQIGCFAQFDSRLVEPVVRQQGSTDAAPNLGLESRTSRSLELEESLVSELDELGRVALGVEASQPGEPIRGRLDGARWGVRSGFGSNGSSGRDKDDEDRQHGTRPSIGPLQPNTALAVVRSGHGTSHRSLQDRVYRRRSFVSREASAPDTPGVASDGAERNLSSLFRCRLKPRTGGAMTIDPKLLEILVCPVDKTPLEVVDLPAEIRARLVDKYREQFKDEDPVVEIGLASPAGRIYPVVSGIPVMLVDEALSREEIES